MDVAVGAGTIVGFAVEDLVVASGVGAAVGATFTTTGTGVNVSTTGVFALSVKV